jgi:hypothetical protein
MADLCAHCGRSFGSPVDLVTHVKKTHAGGNPSESLGMNPASQTPGVTCALCGRNFLTPTELAAHALRPHSTSWPAGRPSTY